MGGKNFKTIDYWISEEIMDKEFSEIFSLDDLLDSRVSLDELFLLRDLKHRKIYLDMDVDNYSIPELVKYLVRYNEDDKLIDVKDRKPIYLFISSNGGDVDMGFELIDVIENSKTPVYTVNIGKAYSMAFLISLAGKKRYATKNSKFLLHDGASLVYNSGAKVQDQIKFQGRIDDRIKQYVISHSKLTEKEYDEKLRIEWYMFANEAKEKGFIDGIIGEDIEF